MSEIGESCRCGPPVDAGAGARGDQRIVCAAVFHDGVVYQLPAPARHFSIRIHMLESHGVKGYVDMTEHGGFILEDGRFVRRRAAERIALATGQVKEIRGSTLTSEDLW